MLYLNDRWMERTFLTIEKEGRFENEKYLTSYNINFFLGFP